ncbi:hypothetical protein DRO97_03875 [Archaeoglobales archaeon]|nr:MAG: hypothetical protein DRO97_03875 [Archaeoglobales archaeon]
MISITFIGIVQSVMLPQWNKAVEIEHSEKLSYEIAKIGEAVTLSASTGKSNLIALKASLSYPERPFLVSPKFASATISTKELEVSIKGDGFNINEKTYAVIVSPNYYYSTKPEFIFEHTAVFKMYGDDTPILISEQGSFSKASVNVYILNTTFDSLAVTQPVNLIFEPISYGGSSFVDNVWVNFTCFDSETAKWWNETLIEIYGEDNVKRNGNWINVSVGNVYLSVSYLVVQALTAGEQEINIGRIANKLVPLQNTSIEYQMNIGDYKEFGVKVVDKYNNPVPNIDVSVGSSGACDITSTTGKSDNGGQVKATIRAVNSGDCTINFNIPTSTVHYNIHVSSPSGGGTIFDVYWIEGESVSWNVSEEGNSKNLNFKVEYNGNPVYNAQVYFSIDNPSIISITPTEGKTNESGIVSITLNALDNGDTNVFGTCANSADVITVSIESVGLVNNPPSQPSLTTDKDRYYVGETITATAFGSTDPDGDPIIYEYKFVNQTDGGILQDWSSDNTYTIASGLEGKIIRVYARACDNKSACSLEAYKDVGIIKTITLYPTDDAYVYEVSPSSNYGSSTSLHVQSYRFWGLNFNERTYIKFNLSSISSTSYVLDAKLQLYAYSSNAQNRNYEVHKVTSNWDENTITWSSQPSFETTATDTISPTSNSWNAWTVTSDVQNMISGNNYGWCIKDESESSRSQKYTHFYSKEYSDTAYHPKLVVEYSPI